MCEGGRCRHLPGPEPLPHFHDTFQARPPLENLAGRECYQNHAKRLYDRTGGKPGGSDFPAHGCYGTAQGCAGLGGRPAVPLLISYEFRYRSPSCTTSGNLFPALSSASLAGRHSIQIAGVPTKAITDTEAILIEPIFFPHLVHRKKIFATCVIFLLSCLKLPQIVLFDPQNIWI